MENARCSEVMPTADGTTSGAMVQLPPFLSGPRVRVESRDGQVYLCDLKGWQSSVTRRRIYPRSRTWPPIADRFHAEDGVNCFSAPLRQSDRRVELQHQRWAIVPNGRLGYGIPCKSR
jgi:hypothetical protein